MKNYVQYHNSDKQGGRPVSGMQGYSIFSTKSIGNLVGQRVWLISGEGVGKKRFFLEYTFVVSDVDLGSPNVARGKEGHRFSPPVALSDKSWFESFKKGQQNFSLGVREIGGEFIDLFESLLRASQEGSPLAADPVSGELSIEQYLALLKVVEPRMTAAQRLMLLAHANAPDQTLSMKRIGKSAGYERFETANLQYGGLAGLLCDAAAVKVPQKMQFIAKVSPEHDDEGHFQWRLKPSFAEALAKLWPEEVFPVNPGLQHKAAVTEVDADSQCAGASPTERAALVMARVGQGAFRRSMAEFWRGRCAVTGCDLDLVLVASHAKPWSTSSNQERLDPFNGLLLAASVDKLFDRGLIAFADDGLLLACESLTDGQLHQLGLSRTSRLAKVDARHLPYLRHHRELVFKKRAG